MDLRYGELQKVWRGRRLGPETETVRREMLVERVSHHARLHANAPPLNVERHDPIQMPARIDNDSAPDHLPGH